MILLLMTLGCGSEDPPTGDIRPTAVPQSLDVVKLREQAVAIFGSLPAEATSAKNPITEEKIALGRMLYYDTRLSKNLVFALERIGRNAVYTQCGRLEGPTGCLVMSPGGDQTVPHGHCGDYLGFTWREIMPDDGEDNTPIKRKSKHHGARKRRHKKRK